ncbi:hypothetical protein B0T26DRAFT_631225 [Lasiosphaeria miniovina]|uniref:NAD-dependent epimerase/dehydratase domain-containing protein n=1 Tax=Lasiosphaeria miniovina TaxID=1954250 RepID=A0AA40EEK2_9PEZI|nr:uncharacterized protein B0T26DRAFT_631225 [Lasiosphaeria miniovina]KAK0734601.1 hypothetical protein B0T26DRAFT_631225 [Lasiosphaeria miniovina]
MAHRPIKFAAPPAIPPGSLILVTGANGLIASHVVDQLLAGGYRVRGTVRSLERSAWLEPCFAARHGAGRLEIVEVPDLAAPGVWDMQFSRGVAGIMSVAGLVDLMLSDVEAAVADDLAAVHGMLRAAQAQPSVKAFVLTSTVWAAWTPEADVARTVTEASWNDAAVALAGDASVPRDGKGIAPFMAFRTRVEQACWDWVGREKPRFAFNTVLPDMVLGTVFDARAQTASTSGMVKWLHDGARLDVLERIPPQWFINAADNGRLYLALLATGVSGQRVFGCAGRFGWPAVLEVLKAQYPEKQDFVDLADAGQDKTELQVQSDKALALLRATGQDSWTSMEQSVRSAMESYLSV